jgi:thioredoxin-related protein
MLQSFRIIALFSLVWSASLLAEVRDPSQYFFDQTFGDFQEELATARDAGKQGILIMFQMDECPFCHRMKERVLNQSQVQDFFKEHFAIFSVDIEGDVQVSDFQGNATTEKDFAFRQFKVRATPVFAFIDLDGKQIARYTGATRDVAEFMLLGRYVVEGHYKQQSFTRYKRDQRSARGS